MATPAEIRRMVAERFNSQGWEFDLAAASTAADAAARTGQFDGAAFAASLPAAFFERNGTTREHVTAVLNSALGGTTLDAEDALPTIIVNDNRYQLKVGRGARIIKSNVNLGDGSLIAVDGQATKADLLDAIAVLVSAGIAGDWNAAVATELAQLIEVRDDISVDDVKAKAIEVAAAEKPKKEHVGTMLREIATAGLGGALATGISAGLGEVLSKLSL